jgi:RNA-directed DNA polymerase
MKREGQLLPRIATWDNLGLAFHQAAAGKRGVPEVVAFASNLDAELNGVVADLQAGTWQPGPFRRFVVRDPKLRVIHAAPFRDRVMHHALMNIAGAGFERGAIDHSYACRTGRGNRAAVLHARRCTRRHSWCLKLDVRRYFDSIPHDRLRFLFRRRFKDGAFLGVLDRIVAGFSVSPGRGLPIGTLTSQYFANFYLDGLDRFVTEGLCCPAYVRYMDDFLLWHEDPAVLTGWRDQVCTWLATERGLALKALPEPVRCADGVPFLGYRMMPDRILLGRPARRRFAGRLRSYEDAWRMGRLDSAELQRRVDSLLAFTDLAACRNWRRRIVSSGAEEADVANQPRP